jgi:predicted nucleic-acid-binding Zn-ribbon protein
MILKCPKCGAAMEQGFLLDVGHANAGRQSQWVAGEPEASFWLGLKVSDRPVLEVTTLRCTRCGFLESYAR